MAFVLVPASVKAHIRVTVVNAKPIMWSLTIPLDNKFRSFRPCGRLESIRIEGRFQLSCFNGVWNVLYRRNIGTRSSTSRLSCSYRCAFGSLLGRGTDIRC